MGVIWVTDVISWIHENCFNGAHYMSLYYVWLFSDLINALHGVFIFIVVGCQPQVKHSHTFYSTHIANVPKSFDFALKIEQDVTFESSLTPKTHFVSSFSHSGIDCN